MSAEEKKPTMSEPAYWENYFTVDVPTTEDVYHAYRCWYDPEYNNSMVQGVWLKKNREEFEAWLLTIQAEAWDAAIEAVQSRMGEDGLLDQHRLIRLENPYRQKEES